MNPCPCGYLGDPRKRCTCSDIQLSAYRTRLSGPLLDRFDMQIAVERVGRRQMLGEPDGETSVSVRERVDRCRLVQSERYGSTLLTNASAPRSVVHRHLNLTTEAVHILGAAIEGLALSGRGVDRSLRVARTIADLAGSEHVTDDHIGEAISLRVAGRLEAGLCA
jgi:magnesium chelatase family protein